VMSSPFLFPFSFPSFFSTVTPGQFPTYWFAPVRALNIVVLPQFGFPASAILIAISFPSLLICIFGSARIRLIYLFYLYALGIIFSDRKFIPAYRDFNRVSQRSYFLSEKM